MGAGVGLFGGLGPPEVLEPGRGQPGVAHRVYSCSSRRLYGVPRRGANAFGKAARDPYATSAGLELPPFEPHSAAFSMLI
jgi:hypothetical protein